MIYQAFGKRLFDILLTTIGLVAIVPLIAVIAIISRIILGKSVFFYQERPGKNGKPFVLRKFRTMIDARDSNGEMLPDSERLLPFGRFLRSTSLDELPEFYNVLVGDMSLVGPRPLLMRYLDRYTPEQARRHEVRPGITGWAQIHGRNDITWQERFQRDSWYVDNHSFQLDLKILFITVYKTILRHGINQRGEATMEEFFGK